MAKFMIQASYNSDGTKGLQKEGGSSRRAVVKKMVEEMGGKLEGFYFAFGEADAVVICELPDVVSALAISLAVNASGQAHVKTTPLITPEEVDAASHKAVQYRAPGR
jgi:uncharacterized protein with GYD domain